MQSNCDCATSLSMYESNTSSQKKIKHYQNPAGPGDYDIPYLTGYKHFVGEKTNAPQFSFGLKNDQKFISKQYL